MATELVEAVAEETLEFPAVKVDRRFLINRQGKDYVTYPGLVDALHQLAQGFFSLDTRVEQLPSADNGHQAVCSALVRVYDPDNPDVIRRSASGIGDASAENVSAVMKHALIRMAETRAKARALRDLLNVGVVAFEELGPEEAAPAPAEHIVVGNRTYSRDEVVAQYRKRKAEAQAAGIALGEVEPVDPLRAPLSVLVGKSQDWKRRLEAKAQGS